LRTINSRAAGPEAASESDFRLWKSVHEFKRENAATANLHQAAKVQPASVPPGLGLDLDFMIWRKVCTKL
jgi:hypothetical protein